MWAALKLRIDKVAHDRQTRTTTMGNEISELLMLAILSVVAIRIADWAMRPKDRKDDN